MTKNAIVTRAALLLFLAWGNQTSVQAGRPATQVQPDGKTLCAMGRFKHCSVKPSIDRGMFETGLQASFPRGIHCRTIDEGWAIDYSHKRPRQIYHGGIDIPVPWGAPMIAAATGTVVAVFEGRQSPRGKEIILQHSPEESGLPVWIYTQYSHFQKLPRLKVGQRVVKGQELGPTGNSGISPMTGRQSRRRRPAIHFGAFYSNSDQYVIRKGRLIPLDGYWMDPLALYRGAMPIDSAAMKALPKAEKKVPIAVLMDTGEVVPDNAGFIWPYTCSGKPLKPAPDRYDNGGRMKRGKSTRGSCKAGDMDACREACKRGWQRACDRLRRG